MLFGAGTWGAKPPWRPVVAEGLVSTPAASAPDPSQDRERSPTTRLFGRGCRIAPLHGSDAPAAILRALQFRERKLNRSNDGRSFGLGPTLQCRDSVNRSESNNHDYDRQGNELFHLRYFPFVLSPSSSSQRRSSPVAFMRQCLE